MRVSFGDTGWLIMALEALRYNGYAIIESVLEPAFIEATKGAMYRAKERIEARVGLEKLRRAGEINVLRLMMLHDPLFFRFLELPAVLEIIDQTVSSTAILHLQNGFILPPAPAAGDPGRFQNTFHQDFPRVLNGYLVSINLFFAIDEFNELNGATLVVPGTHQRMEKPQLNFMNRACLPLVCPAGSMVAFDSTLWHAAGANLSDNDRLAINHQFTRSYLKPQIDYHRALGEEVVKSLPERSQQLLGRFSRTPSDYEEFYREESERLYRRGQG